MNTSVLESLAAQQHQTRRRQRTLQHATALAVTVLLFAGATKAHLFALPSPAETVSAAGLAIESGLTPHGPTLAPEAEARVGRAAIAPAVVKPVAAEASTRKRTRVRRAEQFDPAAFEGAEGVIFEEGIASYYGDEFAGRPTANGEIFDPEGMTAAHRTLPLGSIIRVTNLRNDRSIVVRINDRGPFAGDRVLDLSHGAAVALKMKKRGTARIRIEVL